VSVGLIEKLQLSNCRKPVFRWKVRDANASADMSESVDGEELEIKTEVTSDPSLLAASTADNTPAAVHDGRDPDDTDAFKTSQSCDSDMSEEDDGSDSQSDASNYGGTKRKQNDLDAPDSGSSEDEAVVKRARSEDSAPARPPVMAPTPTPSVLCMDSTNTPVHPRDMLAQKEEELRAFMQQYTKEYVDYLMAHQRTSPTADQAPAGASTSLSSTRTPSNAAASTARDVHSTPVTLPSVASSVQELLLTESPQSVEMLPAAMRVDGKTLPAITTSPVAAAGDPTADSSPKPLLLRKAQDENVAAQTSKTVDDDDSCYNASLNLIRALQPPAAHS
jgi:hypothetical protein